MSLKSRGSSDSNGDPEDEPYINLAISGNASFLVSRDKDILEISLLTPVPMENGFAAWLPGCAFWARSLFWQKSEA